MSTISQFFDAVLDGTRTAAGDAARQFLKQASVDSQAFKQKAEEDLKRWTKQRADGDLDDDEFKELIRDQWADLALAALLKAQITAADAVKLRDKVIDVAIDAAFKILL